MDEGRKLQKITRSAKNPVRMRRASGQRPAPCAPLLSDAPDEDDRVVQRDDLFGV
jgi:hypothetical protein